jgi:methyl-accepting chemotaxis protein
MFKNLSLKQKLVSAFLAVASVIAVVGVVTNVYLGKVTASYGFVSDVVIPTLAKVNKMSESVDKIGAGFGKMGNERISKYHPQFAKEIADADAEYRRIEEEYLKLEFMPGEEEIYKQVKSEWDKTAAISKQLLIIGIDEHAGAEEKYSKMYIEDFLPQFLKLEEKLDRLSEFEEKASGVFSKKAMDAATQLSVANVTLAVAGFLLSIFLGMMMASTITKSLQKIIDSITGSSNEVASASEQISSSSVELSESSTEQASAIQETASALEEVTAMIVRNSENAKTSQTTSQVSREAAEEGQRAAAEMINSIGEINRSNETIISKVEESNQSFSDIVLVINEISNKTKVINDIVFQTKLLSFNASVEAARAGEHGKGFAVVAEEVGHLAQMSGNAAKEISGMLEESVKKVENIVSESKGKIEQLMVEGRRKVENGNEAAKKCGDTLGEILEKVQQVDGLVAEIVTASTEQSQGIQEINKAMSQLDTATAQNSAVSQQTASASEQLSAQSRNLNGLILDLSALITGKREESDVTVSKRSNAKTAPGKPGKVLPMAKKETAQPTRTNSKIVANGQSYPSSSDPRFEEV